MVRLINQICRDTENLIKLINILLFLTDSIKVLKLNYKFLTKE